ncbi:hypothetical protein PM082_020395 [Marasmius tenuissimus]|nr:hypothetical protein PM082_020395 [Marasmius tenuissimus]
MCKAQGCFKDKRESVDQNNSIGPGGTSSSRRCRPAKKRRVSFAAGRLGDGPRCRRPRREPLDDQSNVLNQRVGVDVLPGLKLDF